MAKADYLDRLQLAVETMHGCFAVHTATVTAHEVFREQTVWQGDVEVFNLTGHPKAKRCYRWNHREDKDDTGERFLAVLEMPPVESAVTAVRASIVSDSKRPR